MIGRWIARRALRRVDEQVRLSPPARAGLDRVVPQHWSYLISQIALWAFVYLLVSGAYLSLFFDASDRDTTYHGGYAPFHGLEASAAYVSTVRLSWDVRFGLVMRQSHHWAALIFIGAIVVHLLRVFFTGGFRRPRQLNWVIGVVLLLLSIVEGFIGYSLPDDLLSATGLRVADGVLKAVPVIGAWATFLLFGGEYPGEEIVVRLNFFHTVLVPALIVAVLGLHLLLVFRQRHAQFPGPGRTEHNLVGVRLWPAYAVRSTGLLFAVSAVCLLLGGLVQINPIWLWGPYQAGAELGPAQPDWYTGWIDGGLRLFPGWEPTVFGYRMPDVFIPALVMPAITFLLVFGWPWLERWVTKDRAVHHLLDRPRDHPARTGAGVAALTFYLLLLTAWSLDVVSRYTGIPDFVLVYIFRGLVFAVPLLTGLVTYTIARALRDSEAERAMELTWSDLRASHPFRRRVPEAPAMPEEPGPQEQDEQEKEKQDEPVAPARLMPVDLPPVRVEPGVAP